MGFLDFLHKKPDDSPTNGMATVIECYVEDGLLVKKCDTEDFFTGSQLILHESQEALFFLNGKALDLLSKAGKHTLETQTLPLLSKVLDLPLKGTKQFRAELYFINCTEQMGIRWGTDNPFTFIDKLYDHPFNVGAHGQMSLKVKDSRRFIIKLVGTNKSMDREKTVDYFESFVRSRVASHFPQILENNNVSVFEVDKYITFCSEQLQKMLQDDLEDYGLDIPMFRVEGFSKPEDDKSYQDFLDLRRRRVTDIVTEEIEAKKEAIRQDTAARGVVVSAEADAKRRELEGIDRKTERAFDVAEKLAENDSAGGMANVGIGLGAMGGMAAGMGPATARFIDGLLAPISQDAGRKPSQNISDQKPPNAGVPGQLGLRKDSAPINNGSNGSAGGGINTDEILARLDFFEQLRRKGRISEEEFQARRKELLDSVSKLGGN